MFFGSCDLHQTAGFKKNIFLISIVGHIPFDLTGFQNDVTFVRALGNIEFRPNHLDCFVIPQMHLETAVGDQVFYFKETLAFQPYLPRRIVLGPAVRKRTVTIQDQAGSIGQKQRSDFISRRRYADPMMFTIKIICKNSH